MSEKDPIDYVKYQAVILKQLEKERKKDDKDIKKVSCAKKSYQSSRLRNTPILTKITSC